MDAQKLTQKSQEALQAAQARAAQLGHQQVDVPHLLRALIEPGDGLVHGLLRRMEVAVEPVLAAIDAELARLPKLSGPGFDRERILLTQELAQVLTAAEAIAQKMRDDFVSVEHLFLAMLQHGRGGVRELLRKFQIDEARFLNALKEVRGNQRVQSQN